MLGSRYLCINFRVRSGIFLRINSKGEVNKVNNMPILKCLIDLAELPLTEVARFYTLTSSSECSVAPYS